MAVNDTRVLQIIDDAIWKANHNGDLCCGKYRQAWRNLKAWRDQPPAPGMPANSLDVEVAAAENYMFARACVCEGYVNSTQMQTIGVAYYATKVAGVKMPTSGNPQSPASPDVLNWGMRGAMDGANDCRRCNTKANPPLWRPVNEIMNLGNGYGGQLARPGTAYAPPRASA